MVEWNKTNKVPDGCFFRRIAAFASTCFMRSSAFCSVEVEYEFRAKIFFGLCWGDETTAFGAANGFFGDDVAVQLPPVETLVWLSDDVSLVLFIFRFPYHRFSSCFRCRSLVGGFGFVIAFRSRLHLKQVSASRAFSVLHPGSRHLLQKNKYYIYLIWKSDNFRNIQQFKTLMLNNSVKVQQLTKYHSTPLKMKKQINK